MAIGTLFTLFVVPSLYVLIAGTRSAHADEPVSDGELFPEVNNLENSLATVA
jgi:hypothetical protein